MFDFAGWGSSAIAARLASGREDKSRRAARAADPEKEDKCVDHGGFGHLINFNHVLFISRGALLRQSCLVCA